MSWAVEDLKRRHLLFCTIKTRGNLHEAARLLGMNVKTIFKWVHDYNLEKVVAMLRLVHNRGGEIRDAEALEYEKRNAEFDEVISKSLVEINRSMDADVLLKDIRDLKLTYEQTFEEREEEEYRERKAYKSRYDAGLPGRND